MKIFKVLILLLSLIFLSNNLSANDKINYKSKGLYPENFTYVKELNGFLLGSMKHGKIGFVDMNGKYSDFITHSSLITVLGVKVKNGKIYVTTSDLGIGGKALSTKSTPSTINRLAKVVIFDLKTKKLLNEYDVSSLFPKNTDIFLDDLDIDSKGNIYAVESFYSALIQIPADPTKKPFMMLDDKAFKASGVDTCWGFHLNGVAVSLDGEYLVIPKCSDGKLFKVSLDGKSTLNQIKTPFALSNADAIVFNNKGELLLARNNGNIHILSSNDNFNSVKVISSSSSEEFKVPTSVTTDGNVIYVNNSFYNVLSSFETDVEDFFISVYKGN